MVITKIWNGIHSKCRREKQDRDFTGASSGYDSTLPLQRAQVQYLVRELRFHVPHSPAKRVNQKGF